LFKEGWHAKRDGVVRHLFKRQQGEGWDGGALVVSLDVKFKNAPCDAHDSSSDLSLRPSALSVSLR